MEDIARALLEILLGDTSVRGLRVVRGPHWKWGDQDGGAGFLGTVEKCMGSTVSVLWDNGSRNKYRTGLDGNYDLRIVDNATAGVSHNVICDECNDRPLKGIRWKCVPCSDYDLCSACYHAGKHDLLHKFYRIDTPSSDGVEVGTRKDASTWTLKGIFQGARVQRGLDWSWDDQDGGKGGKGTVLKITDGSKKTNSWRSWADVQWDHGKKNSYRVGAKGFVDLQFTTNAEGGSYFIEHLPVLDEKGAPGQPVDQSNRGLRVVRGRDWSWGDQDDGEGHVGTVEHFLVTQKVQVRWDNGQANHYYIGRHGRLDLRIFDNATVVQADLEGNPPELIVRAVNHNYRRVEHNSVTCDACKEHPVKGFRWKCKVCADYDLCTKCYMSDKHDTSHQFYRMTTSKSKKVLLPTRQGAKVEARGIFPGAVVVRGIDWTWENQDGGEGKTGVMSWGLKVKDGTPTRSWVEVKWDSSRVRADYRLGYKGYVDLKYTKDASGGHYYPDHLPLLGLDENSTTACDEEDPPIWEDASAITNEWYAGKISARDAVDKLTSPGIEVGTFLVRDSESLAGAYAISVRHLKTVKNYRVKRDENGFFIEKGRPFRTLPQLVNFYSQENTGILQLKHAFRQMFRDVIYESMDKKNDVDMNDRSALKIIGRLGGGSFGDVFAAEWNHQTKVAIKVLKKGQMDPKEFIAEGEIMKKLSHDNIVRLHAIFAEREPILIVMEHMHHGSLLKYMEEKQQKLETTDLMRLSAQIASGMAYLESMKYVHRDLAARNVLVGEDNVAKVADFGMARFVESKGVYESSKRGLFPVRWTAPEVIICNNHTIKSDVWSYGILLTEVVTRGGQVPYPGQMDPKEFIAEGEIMKKLSHDNIVRLHAIFAEREPILIVMEHMHHGSLLKYMEEKQQKLETTDLMRLSAQIASGMAYLESMKYVHRDLAARNVLVGEDNVAKVADFGMARFVESKGVYESSKRGLFPMRWTAPEVIICNNHTIKSDVWSYGILLTEVVTRGGQVPYPDIRSNDEVIRRVTRGHRMSSPPNCPPKVYDIMNQCWHKNPEKRPSFQNLTETVSKLAESAVVENRTAIPPRQPSSRITSLIQMMFGKNPVEYE